jgi:hypothetical protein
MSLITCKECGKEYSSSARACPHCGKRRTSSFKIVLYAVLFVMIIILVSSFNRRSQEAAEHAGRVEAARQASLTPEERAKERAALAKEKRWSSARGACLLSLKANLHDPESARLDSSYTWHVEERKNGTILVQPTGRAKNAFGTYIKGTWNCVTKQQGNDIIVMSLKQIRP